MRRLCLLPSGRDVCFPSRRPDSAYRSPIHLVFSEDGTRAYVVNHTSSTVSILDVRTRAVVGEFPVGDPPVHASISNDTLLVSSLYEGVVHVIDPASRRTIPTGHEPYGIHGRYVANAISDTVSDLETGRQIPVGRQPRFLAQTPDGKRLVVSNGLSRNVSIIDTQSGKVVETRDLGRAFILRQIACTNRWAFVAHLLSHDEQVTTQIERGWIHSNGISILDLDKPGHRVTILLDRPSTSPAPTAPASPSATSAASPRSSS